MRIISQTWSGVIICRAGVFMEGKVRIGAKVGTPHASCRGQTFCGRGNFFLVAVLGWNEAMDGFFCYIYYVLVRKEVIALGISRKFCLY